MQNFIQSGKTLTLVAPSGGVRSGEFVQVGSLHGFAITDAAEGVPVSVSREGVYSAPKAGVEIHQGNKLYFDAFNKVFTTSVTGVNLAVATEDAASGDPTCALVLLPETEAASGGGGGHDPDGTTIDLDMSNHLRVKAAGHTHPGNEITSVVAQASHATSADTATSATSAGNADTLDGHDATDCATSGHSHAYLPSTDAKAALAGTNGTPSDTNRYVTNSDPRLSGGGGGGGPDMVDVTVALGESTATTAPAPGHVGWLALGVLPAGADVGVANVVVNVDGSVTLTTLAASTAGSAFKVCLFNPGS